MRYAYELAFLGAGKMAEGILAAVADRSRVIMAERDATRARDMRKRCDVKVVADAAVAAAAAKTVFVAVRPQDLDAVAAQVAGILRTDQTLVSIVAGKTLAKLRAAFGPKVRLVRVMPNLALRSQAGMCALCGEKRTPAATLKAVRLLLARAGEAVVLPERDFDAVTALSGSGPAYFAYMAAAMAEGGVKLGLKREVARLLAEQTMYGTAKFLRESGMDLDKFIAGVCTRGGTTAAGMVKLDRPPFKRAVAETLKAAARRSAELA